MPILKRRDPALCDVVVWIGLEDVLDTAVVIRVLLVSGPVVSCGGLIEGGLYI